MMIDLSSLNENQRLAVTTKSKYTRIIAGAGSGKTRVLTYRIAYLIENNLAYPSGIIGITFTNKAAKEIKDRVKTLVSNSEGMSLCTIHSWCAKFLRLEAHHIGYPRNFAILDEEDTNKIMKDIFASHGLAKNDPDIKKCLNWIASKKTEGLQYKDIEQEVYPNRELESFATYFKEYEQKLKDMYAFDFDDLLLKTIDILLDESNGVARRYRNKISHILVDEFQDINDVQFHLITLLLSNDTELYVVGDPDQTIYTWRGANNRIIMDLEKTLQSIFPSSNVEMIVLNQNYRSTKTILDSANKLIANNFERVKKDLIAVNEQGSEVSFFKAPTMEDEASYVVNTIKELHHESINYKNIAILYRANYLTRELETRLSFYRIPYRIYGGMKFYQRKEIKDVLAFLNLIINPFLDVHFLRIINVPKKGIGQSSIDKIVSGAAESGQSIYHFILENSDKISITESKKNLLKKMVNTIEKIKSDIESCEDKKRIPELLEDGILIDLKYLEELSDDKESEEERKENVEEFFASMKMYYQNEEDASFEAFVENCALQSSQDEVQDGDYVSLMTVHTAKGLEFDYVFVYGLNEGVFPSARAVEESRRGLEEERRLAYVAYTRAKKKLYLTCNLSYSYVMQDNLRPSRFIKEAGIYSKNETQNKFVTENTYQKINKNVHAKNKVVPPTVKTNGIKNWAVGDRIKHESYGLGSVIEVKNNLIVVKFDNLNFGTKTLLSSHFMISKL